MNIETNFVAIFLAGIVSMIIGFLWYGPVFGKTWEKLKGFTAKDMKEGQKQAGTLYTITFIASLLTAFVLSHVMVFAQNFFGYSMLSTGITSAIWMWLGFVMPVQLSATLFSGKNWKLLGIDTGYQLLTLLAMGIVIGLL